MKQDDKFDITKWILTCNIGKLLHLEPWHIHGLVYNKRKVSYSNKWVLPCVWSKLKKCMQFAIRNLQFCKVPALPPPYKAGWVVKLTYQYDPDFQAIRISHATPESIHLNKSINHKDRIQIITMNVFCFNMWYYSMSKIWFSTLETMCILDYSSPCLFGFLWDYSCTLVFFLVSILVSHLANWYGKK